MGFKHILGAAKLAIQKASPEILTGLGVAGMFGGAFLAYKAYPAMDNVKEDYYRQLSRLQERRSAGSIDEKTFKREKAKLLAKATGEAAKVLAPTGGALAGGATLVGVGMGVLRGREARAIATAAGIGATFDNYRKNAIAYLGEEGADLDKRFLFGADKQIILADPKVDPETGEILPSDEPDREVYILGNDVEDPRFALFSSETSQVFSGNPIADLAYLKARQAEANDRLHIYGNLTVNWVRDHIGMKEIDEGIDNGWVCNGNGDGYVDFGIFDRATGEPRFDISRYVDGIPMEFNIDGNIKGLLKRRGNAR